MATEYAERDLQVITEILSRLLNEESVSVNVDEDIYQAGLTSIMVLPLLVELEESFQVVIPDTQFMEARSARALARLVAQVRNSS
jgi:acyl carrier protein